MNIKNLVAPALTAALALGLVASLAAGAADKPKLTTKDVMKEYHKGDSPLCKKVAGGQGTKEEFKKFVEAYTAMAAEKPPKGDEKEWKERTGKLLAAAKALEAGKPDATVLYKDAVNCKACHTAHKPD